MIKAVIFDVDGVLLDSFEANLKFFQDLMSKFGYPPPKREDYQNLFHHSMKDLIRIFSKSQSEEEVEKIWKAGRDREVRYPFELLILPERVKETLEILSKDYELGIVTNRTGSGIYGVPQLAKLKGYFAVVVGYEDTENHKPHPDPLILAAKKLNIEPAEAVYVGDSETDIHAAKAAGMKAVLYSNVTYPGADASTSVFAELPELIKKL